MVRVLFSLLVAWFLLWTGSALNCEYDPSVDERQGLNFLSAVGQVTMQLLEDVSNPDKCRERCCNSTECDLVLMGYPMDGLPQCTLVKCHVNGKDGCDLKPSTQFKVYRKSGSRRSSEEGTVDEGERRVAPLVQSVQPKEGNESNSKSNTEAGGVWMVSSSKNARGGEKKMAEDVILICTFLANVKLK